MVRSVKHLMQSASSIMEWRAGDLAECLSCQIPVKLVLLDRSRADSRSTGICRDLIQIMQTVKES